MKKTIIIFVLLIVLSCSSDESDTSNPSQSIYYPPIGSTEWETTSPEDLNWNATKIPELLSLLENGKTRAFIILIDGKIVMENYWGKDLLNLTDFDQEKNWYWASAAKTLTAFTIGKAEEEGFLSVADKTSNYLGSGWTSMTSEQENKITIFHQLSMTSGLDDSFLGLNIDILAPENLKYKADPGERWSYHNPPYTLLAPTLEAATGEDFNTYFNTKLSDKIGMNGNWIWSNYKHLYFSTARSMARFGHLILNSGKWENEQLLNEIYIQQMTSTSQAINKGYGYLWWLNDKKTYMLPGLQIVFPENATPSAPIDMYSGIGKDGQYVCVIPSKKMVLVRMGENPDNALVPVKFLEDIWGKLNEIMP